MRSQDSSTKDLEKRYNFTRRQKNLMNVLRRPVEIATQSGHDRSNSIMDFNLGTKVTNELEETEFADGLGKRLDAGFRG